MSTLASPSVQEQQFLEAFQQAIDTQKLDRVVLSQYKGELEQLEKITLRIIQLNQEQVLSCLYRHKTQDITKNYPLAQAEDLQLQENKMKAISFVEAKDIIGGALNPFAGLVKGAQLGYDTGASIMGMVGGVVGGILGGAMGFLGALVGSYN